MVSARLFLVQSSLVAPVSRCGIARELSTRLVDLSFINRRILGWFVEGPGLGVPVPRSVVAFPLGTCGTKRLEKLLAAEDIPGTK